MMRYLALATLGLATVAASCGPQGRGPTLPHWGGQTPRPTSSSPIEKYTGLSSPESVWYDAAADRYLVSNVNGSALTGTGWRKTVSNHGFISVLSPQGNVTALKWIEDGRDGVHLDAPKGIVVADGVLYVADVNVVRTFDARTGGPRRDIRVIGATFLTDLAAGEDGRIYLTDAGVPDGSFNPTGTDSVYVIEGERVTAIARGTQLNRPEALAWTTNGLVVGSFESNEVYRLDAKGAKQDVTRIPSGGVTGIVPLGDFLLVTSWQSSSVLLGKLGSTFEVALTDQQSPADIGYDAKRARLLVPHFDAGTVDAYALR
jgi:hypothetical protein